MGQGTEVVGGVWRQGTEVVGGILCVPACSGADEFTSHTEQEEMRKVEKQLKNRFPVGSMVSEQRIVQDFLQQVTCKTACVCVCCACI